MSETPSVMTVTGPVPADELGVVLPHEHIFVNTMREYRGNGLLHDPAVAVEELRDFASVGGRTIVELTTSEIGRNPEQLARASRDSGVHVLMGCGHYREPYWDLAQFESASVDGLAEAIIREVEDGVGTTGIRPGIIGEIGNQGDALSDVAVKSFRAAARAHTATGLTLSTHAAWFPVGIAQLDVLESEGVAPHRVIIGHVDGVPGPDYQLELASRGCYVELDGFGTDSPYDSERALVLLQTLRDRGHLRQVLISHDVFLRSHMRRRGGPGYTWISRELVPRLAELGFTDDDVHQLTVANPRRALTGELSG